jgi:putative membrane protein
MNETPDSRTSIEPVSIRDHLAVDRTVLANERTLLAYVRTSLGLLAVGLGILHFSSSVWVEVLLGWTFVVLAVANFGFGLFRFERMRNRITAERREGHGPC